jgi:hypothetical protein
MTSFNEEIDIKAEKVHIVTDLLPYNIIIMIAI